MDGSGPTALDTPCLEWKGGRSSGYGRAWCPRTKRSRGAHVVAWEAVHGPVPAGMLVCHRCDNPPCVNVEHLFVGTPLDNARDRNAKGRHQGPRGMLSGNRKLDWEQVQEIRRRHAAGETAKALAASFGVVPSNVSRIVRYERWLTPR